MRIALSSWFAILLAAHFVIGGIKGLVFFRDINAIVDLAAIALVGMLLISFLRLAGRRFYSSPLAGSRYVDVAAYVFFWSMAGLFFYIALSYAITLTNHEYNAHKFYQFMAYTILPLGAWLLVFRDYRQYDLFVKWLGIFVIAAAVLTLVELLSGSGMGGLGRIESYQWRSRMGFCAFAVMLGYISVGIKGSDRARLSAIIFLASALLLIFSAGGRQGILACIFSLAVMLYLRGATLWYSRATAWLLVGSMLSATLVAGVFRFVSVDLLRFDRIFNSLSILADGGIGKIMEDSGRSQFYREAFNIFSENPIFGVGFGNYAIAAGEDVYKHPHNIVLEVSSELGFIGLTFLLFAVGCQVCLLRRWKRLLQSHEATFGGVVLLYLSFGFAGMALVSGDLGGNYAYFIASICSVHAVVALHGRSFWVHLRQGLRCA